MGEVGPENIAGLEMSRCARARGPPGRSAYEHAVAVEMSVLDEVRKLTDSRARHALLIGHEQPLHGPTLDSLKVPWQFCRAREAARRILQSRLQRDPITCVLIELPKGDSQREAVLKDPVVGSLPIVLLDGDAWHLYSPHAITPAILDVLLRWQEPIGTQPAVPKELSVLVVDDMAVNRKFLEGYLHRLGHRSTEGVTAQEAFELMMRERFDVILMDVEMPDEDGPSLVGRLRRTAGPNQDVPVIAVTGHSEEAEGLRCLESGMDDILVKTEMRLKLAEKLNRWAGRRVIHLFAESEAADQVSAPVALESLLSVTEGNAKLLGEFIGLFTQDVTRCFNLMQQALAEDDEAGFRSCVHSLRGAASYIGAHRLERLAEISEADFRRFWTEGATNQLASLRTEFRRVQNFLQSGLSEPEIVDIEVTATLQLDATEAALLDLHSFLNIFNVVLSELYFLGEDLKRPDSFMPCAAVMEEFSRELRRPDRIKAALLETETRLTEFWREFESVMVESNDAVRVQLSRDNLHSIMAVLRQRAEQMLERVDNPNLWVNMTILELEADYRQLFAAVAKNSKGRYDIVYNVAAQRSQDYLIHLDFSSVDGEFIRMPAVLQDVFRDLTANARKYTEPGGTIQAGLVDDGEQLRLVVEDNGRGIPAHEVPRVVELGYRASNVNDKRTMGSGIGLTKAYWVARRLGGGMRIRSGRDRGTRVSISIPSQAEARRSSSD